MKWPTDHGTLRQRNYINNTEYYYYYLDYYYYFNPKHMNGHPLVKMAVGRLA